MTKEEKFDRWWTKQENGGLFFTDVGEISALKYIARLAWEAGWRAKNRNDKIKRLG